MMLATGAALTPGKTSAWGYEGHAIIADIAAAHLTPTAAKRVSEILKGALMRDVAYFADLDRLTHRETSRWHFVNIAVGASDYRPSATVKMSKLRATVSSQPSPERSTT